MSQELVGGNFAVCTILQQVGIFENMKVLNIEDVVIKSEKVAGDILRV